MAAEESSCASHLVYYIIWRVNLTKVSQNFVWALRITTTNCRVSFIYSYFVFPTNFRIVFLLHSNHVILLEKWHCGIWLSPFYIKTWLTCGALENLKSLCGKHGFTLVDKVCYWKYKLSVIFRGRISRPYRISSNKRPDSWTLIGRRALITFSFKRTVTLLWLNQILWHKFNN